MYVCVWGGGEREREREREREPELVNASHSQWGLKCQGMMIYCKLVWGNKVMFVILAAPFRLI